MSDPVVTDFPVEVYFDGDTLGVIAPVWALSPRVTFQDFLKRYRRAPVETLRDWASVPPTDAERRLFPDVDAVRAKASKRPHPIGNDLSISSSLKPRFASYVMHLDLSESKDSTGIAMVHLDPKSKRIVVDFVHEMPASKGNPIRYADIERLVTVLVARGFYIKKLTADVFNSFQVRQNIENMGIETGLLSTVRDMVAYETLFEAIFSDFLDFYAYPPLFHNLEGLVVRKGKVEKTKGHRKDVADALAGAVLTCLKVEGLQAVPDVDPITDDEEGLAKDIEKIAKSLPDDDDLGVFDTDAPDDPTDDLAEAW